MKHIKNWCMYGVQSLTISVAKTKDNYSPQITIILDDGNVSDSAESLKVITLLLNKNYDNPKDAIYETINGELITLFDKISSEILVLDESNDVIGSYDYNSEFEEYKRDDEMNEEIHMAMMVKNFKKPTIH